MTDWREKYKSKLMTAHEAARLIKSNDRVWFGLGSTPIDIGYAIAERADELRNVTVCSTWPAEFPWFKPGMEESFNVLASYVTPVFRAGIREKRFDWVCWLPGLETIERRTDPNRGRYHVGCDVYLTIVRPPDEEGYCDLGNIVWATPEAVKTARTVIAEVDPSLPRTFGPRVHVSDLDSLVEAPKKPPAEQVAALPLPPPDEFEIAEVIGALAAELIKDGDCVQIGVGTASEGVVPFLATKNDLGMDTEIFNMGMIDLTRAGVVTGKRRNINKGKINTTSVSLYLGDPRRQPAIEFLDGNPMFEYLSTSIQFHVGRIASNDNMVAVNNLLMIDLLGQGVLSHLGPVAVAGVGGQLEYTIGSHYSKGGRSIHCLPSTAKGGKISRIVPQFETGWGVVEIPMGYVDYLVTEYGVVNLEYKTRRERAEAIISVAHPDFRPELRKAARELFYP